MCQRVGRGVAGCGKVWQGAGRFGEIWGYSLGRSGETWGDLGRSGELAHLRVHRELSHTPAKLCELPAVVERAQGVELLERSDEGFGGWRVHKIEMNKVVDPERLEHEDDGAEVGALDLGDRVVLQLVQVGPLSVQPEALTRRDAPRTPCTLVGAGLCDWCDNERLHAGARVVAVLL